MNYIIDMPDKIMKLNSRKQLAVSRANDLGLAPNRKIPLICH